MNLTHTIVALPAGQRGSIHDGSNLRSALRALGVQIESICAENATCGKCLVLVEEGQFAEHGIFSSPSGLSTPSAEEADYLARRSERMRLRGSDHTRARLACQARVQGDVVVTVPDESLRDKQIVRKTASPRSIEVDPLLRKYLVKLTAPSLANPRSDWDRLASGLATSVELVRSGEAALPRSTDFRIDASCLRSLPDVLRNSNWRVTVTVWDDKEVVRVEPGLAEGLFGAAVDIGTTTIALYLCDLSTGETVATASDMNPQVEFGEDVMSRIHFSNAAADGPQTLHKGVIRAVNKLLTEAAADGQIVREDILELVMVGNTTMQHLFLGLSPRHLGAAPFTPVTSRAVDIKARELGLAINRAANVHILPAIGSFVGADTTAVLLAEGPHEQDETWLIIDIGTNAELVLGNRRRLICASTPTGPAFEGAHIEHGMRAAPGAIEHLRIEAAALQPRWKIIGESDWGSGQPRGLCGSAIVDAVAELARTGAIDSSGKFVRAAASDRIREGPAGPEYAVARGPETATGADITVTQQDVRQIQLAKGALFVAAESLLEQFGIDSPDKLLLAGAFGSYIDKHNAMAIGMLPSMALERVFVVGNSAGDGARIALLNKLMRQSAATLASRVSRYELPTDSGFQARFMRALAFPQQPGAAGSSS